MQNINNTHDKKSNISEHMDNLYNKFKAIYEYYKPGNIDPGDRNCGSIADYYKRDTYIYNDNYKTGIIYGQVVDPR